MNYCYKIRTDKVLDEEGNVYTVYGVDVYFGEKLIESIPDIFFDPEEAENFIKECNEEKLDFVHLYDVIENALS